MNSINLHFQELKWSFNYSLVSIIALIAVIYEYLELFLSYYISFTDANVNLIFTDLMEVFYMNIQLSILFGLLFSCPFVMFIFLLYIKPGLYSYENSLFNRLYFIFNFIVLPSVIYNTPNMTVILIDYFNDLSYNQWNYYEVELLQKFENFYNIIFYLNVISLLFSIIPLVIIVVVLPKKHVSRRFERAFKENDDKETWNPSFRGTVRKYVYLTILLALGIVTPPDIISLIVVFTPLFIIYEFITYFICLFNNIRAI